MNAAQIELLSRLRTINDKYAGDPELRQKLKDNVEPSKVKGVLAELDKVAEHPFSPDDQDAIKDIYFNFC